MENRSYPQMKSNGAGNLPAMIGRNQPAENDAPLGVAIPLAGEPPAASPPPIERLLTKPQAAELLGVSARQLDYFIGAGKLRVVRLSRNMTKIDPADLRAFIESLKRQEVGRCERAKAAAEKNS